MNEDDASVAGTNTCTEFGFDEWSVILQKAQNSCENAVAKASRCLLNSVQVFVPATLVLLYLLGSLIKTSRRQAFVSMPVVEPRFLVAAQSAIHGAALVCRALGL